MVEVIIIDGTNRKITVKNKAVLFKSKKLHTFKTKKKIISKFTSFSYKILWFLLEINKKQIKDQQKIKSPFF